MKKNIVINFVISELDKDKLKAIAKANKLSMSNVVRQLIEKEWYRTNVSQGLEGEGCPPTIPITE